MSDPIGITAIIVVGEPLPAAGTGGGIATTTSMTSAPLSAPGGREYRKGNWTIHETMVLITAKKMDDERRMKGGERERSKTAELRWKWVENYCWANGCMRSQNQCNDKWDNLLRDYKKVREYENRPIAGRMSYWQMEKHERKERNLPSNLPSEVFEALHEVVNRKPQPRLGVPPPAYQHQQPPPSLPPPPLPPPPPPPPPPQPPISDLRVWYVARVAAAMQCRVTYVISGGGSIPSATTDAALGFQAECLRAVHARVYE